jgi:hypothetical protein
MVGQLKANDKLLRSHIRSPTLPAETKLATRAPSTHWNPCCSDTLPVAFWTSDGYASRFNRNRKSLPFCVDLNTSDATHPNVAWLKTFMQDRLPHREQPKLGFRRG